MNKFKLLFCILAIGLLTCGIMYQGSKSIAEDLPYLDGFTSKQAIANYLQ